MYTFDVHLESMCQQKSFVGTQLIKISMEKIYVLTVVEEFMLGTTDLSETWELRI